MTTWEDWFCGGGGSSSGLIQIPGVTVVKAVNHWQLAVDTHNQNHQDAAHYCIDISATDLGAFRTNAEFGWFSPSCTKHSQAAGKRTGRSSDAQPDLFDEVLPDEAGERSRATMFDVPRALEAAMHRGTPYRGFIVENVLDVRGWLFYSQWLQMIEVAGYCVHVVSLNSMFAQAGGLPAPQSRDRWYAVGHQKKYRCPDLNKWTRPFAYCDGCDTEVQAVQAWKNPDKPFGRYKDQYVWKCPNLSCRNQEVYPGILPALSVIDLTDPGIKIGDREKLGMRPLAGNTLARVQGGIDRFFDPVTAASRPEDYPPLLVPVEGRDGKRAGTSMNPLRTQTARNETGLATPGFVVRNNGTTGNLSWTATAMSDVFRTITTKGHQSVVTHKQFVLDYNGQARSVLDALPTQTTVDGNGVVGTLGPVQVEDCYFRMLSPREVKLATAFSETYVLLGNKREQVRLAGNAVTPPAARDLAGALMEAVLGDQSLYTTMREVALAA